MTPKQRYRASPKGKRVERTYINQWRAAHPELVLAQKRRNYRRHIEERLRYAFQKSYGITWEERDSILAAQHGRCKICGSETHRAGKRGWHIDHNPTKQKGDEGFIRGVLCLKCNTGLGKFNDNPDLLRAAADYLSSSK